MLGDSGICSESSELQLCIGVLEHDAYAEEFPCKCLFDGIITCITSKNFSDFRKFDSFRFFQRKFPNPKAKKVPTLTLSAVALTPELKSFADIGPQSLSCKSLTS